MPPNSGMIPERETSQQRGLLDEIAVPARPGNLPQIEAAELVQSAAAGQAWQIAKALYQHGPLRREQICAITKMKNSSACARLRELEVPDPDMPALGSRMPVVCKAKWRSKADSGVKVSVYRLTLAGRRLVWGRLTPATS